MLAEAEDDFVCAICRMRVSMTWNHLGPLQQIPPFCRYCETEYGGRGAGLTAGAFRDRREIIRGLAISEALRSEAARQQWSRPHAAA